MAVWLRVIDTIRHDTARVRTLERQQLPPEADLDRVVESLLHMHHNRAIGIAPDSERTCRRLARQAALAWRTRTRQQGGEQG